MALAHGSAARLERLLLKTRSILGEGDDDFLTDNKTQSLQLAASLYGLYTGDGSETDYTDNPSLTIIQSEMIATKAAIDLLTSAISYYKDGIVSTTGGPSSTTLRSDKLAWLSKQIDLLEAKLEELEGANGIDTESDGVPGLALRKVRACCDPEDDKC